MKQFSLLILLICVVAGSTKSQSKTDFGLTTEGSWFMPGKYDSYSPQNKNSFAAGIGAYASQNLFGKLSVDVGVTYRFKQMREYFESFYDSDYGGYSPYGYGYGYGSGYDYGSNYTYEVTIPAEGWKTYLLQYVVVPVHLQYNLYKNIFVSGGIEASWLTNFKVGNDKTEFNWTIGFGSHYWNKLKWSVNYIRGFKGVFFLNKLYIDNGLQSSSGYRNNLLQLSISYPIWSIK